MPNQNKKICIITSVFKPYNKGGAETVVNNIVDGFNKKNYQILVITADKFKNLKSLWPKKTVADNVTIYRFYPLNLFSFLNISNYSRFPLWRLIWHGLDMFNLHSYFAIKHILKKEKPTVAMTHMLKGLGYLTCRAVKKAKIKNIHTLHEVQLITPSGLILKGEENSWQHTFLPTQLYQAFNRWLLNSPEIVISSSKFLLKFHNQKKFFPKSQKIILTNPININIQTRQDKKEDSVFTFLFLGQVEKHKGILLLIKVFKKLLAEQKNIPCKLIIVGTGTALNEAKQLAGDEKNIEFRGYIPNQELNNIFVQSNATIVSSLCYENSPTVIFESLANGVPVIAARIGGIEFIKDDYNGFTFEAGDEEDLFRILSFSLHNRHHLANMSHSAQESVKQIGIDNYIQKLEELF